MTAMREDTNVPCSGCGGFRSGRRVRLGAIVLGVVVALSACTSSGSSSTTTVPTTSSTSDPTTTSISTTTTTTTTTTTLAAVVSTAPFRIELGADGVTYDVDGDPPSGPTSFAVLDDGSVVVADTMAVSRGEPRLLHYDRSGELIRVIDLADEEVASIVDVATNGSDLAVLDVFVAMNRYRVLTLGTDGTVRSVIDVPQGFRFEQGLFGLAWDDSGILLDFRSGESYARLVEDGGVQSPVVPVFGGTSIMLSPGNGRTTNVMTGASSFTVSRETDLGGATLVGIAPDDSIVLVVDEVDLSAEEVIVMRRVQRYTPDGQLQAEQVVNAGDRFLDIPHPLELDPTGRVLYLVARTDHLQLNVLEP